MPRTRHMGIFIISPCDKGGKLYDHLRPTTGSLPAAYPMAFNDLYCLRDPAIHTLSIGAARPSDFVEHVTTVKNIETHLPDVLAIEKRLDHAMVLAPWRRLDAALA